MYEEELSKKLFERDTVEENLKAANDLETANYHASIQAHEVWHAHVSAYDAQAHYVNHVGNQLAGVSHTLQKRIDTQSDCITYKEQRWFGIGKAKRITECDEAGRQNLRNNKAGLEQQLNQAHNELHNSEAAKNHYYNLAAQAHTAWQHSIASKNQANELKNKADANLKALDNNQIQIQTYLNDLDLTKQQAHGINEMLQKLKHLQASEIERNCEKELTNVYQEYNEKEMDTAFVHIATVEHTHEDL